MKELRLVFILIICLFPALGLCQTNLELLGKITGLYEKRDHKLILHSNYEFSSTYDYVSWCGIGSKKEVILGTYSIDTIEKTLRFFPKEFKELYHDKLGRRFNIPYDSIAGSNDHLALRLNIIPFGEDLFLLRGDKEKEGGGEFLSFVNSVNLTNKDNKVIGPFYKKKRWRKEEPIVRKSKENYEDLIKGLGPIYGSYIFKDGPIAVEIIDIDNDYLVPGLYNPFDYSEVHIGLFFSKADQRKLKKGMILYDDRNHVIRIHETKDQVKMGIYVREKSKHQFKIGGFLASQ